MLAVIIFSVLVIVFGFVVFWGAPYVPSHRREVEGAFDTLYPLTKKDTLVDLGSGDGVVLRVASTRGAKAVGYELNPVLVAISRLLSYRSKQIDIRTANFWLRHLPKETTVVYIFSVTRDMKKLKAKLQGEADYLGRPLHLILYAMQLPDQKPVKSHRAHRLYVFTPLHPKEA